MTMANLRHIDEEEYASHALELFNDEREDFVKFAYDCLKDGETPEHTKERLTGRVESHMESALFDYLKEANFVEGDVRYDYSLGYCRRKRVEPRMSDVPSRLLSISEVLMVCETLPNFAQVIESVMVDAGILLKVDKIEATTKEARENG